MARHFMKYNPAFLKEEHLIANFVVRQIDLELIVGIIGENVTASNQHVLVIGPRGSGKTTLALRVAAEIERREELKACWYPLIFSEESYEVVSAGEFWLEALFHLSEQTDNDKWKRVYADLKKETDDQRLGERALGQLLDFADNQGKRILLIVENLNMLFNDLISPDEGWKIRHTLINEPRIMMLATATTKFEMPSDLAALQKMKSKVRQVAANRFVKLDNDANAMYEMFKIHELLPLNDDECNAIWEMIAGQKLAGNRIRPLKILTGGNPRLLTIIAKFGAHRSFRQLLEDLVDLVDDHTEYFKSQLDSLPATERKVYLALAGLWSTSSARDIANAARLEVSKTSSLLNRLIGRGFVAVEEEGKKTKYYQIAERMYNIYYLMRRRGKPSDRVKAAVKFMVSLYDPESATKMIAEEASILLPEQCRDHVLAFEEAIMEVPDKQKRNEIIASAPKSLLDSPYISDTLKNFMAADKEIETKEEASGEIDADLKEEREIIGRGFKLFKEGNYEQAIEIWDKVIRKFGVLDKVKLNVGVAMAMYYKGVSLGALNRSEEANKVYDVMVALYKDRPEPLIADLLAMAMFNKGIRLGALNHIEEAEKTFMMAIEYAPNFIEAHDALFDILLMNQGRHEEALSRANEIINRHSQDARLLNALARTVYKRRCMPLLQSAEAWARQAIAISPDNLNIWHTLACILSALGNGIEAMEAAKKYVQDAAFVEKTVEGAIELFVELAASGYAKGALDILANSPAAKHLEPLVVALKLFVGDDVRTAVEISEVAKDVVKRIEERQQKRKQG